MLGSPLLPMPNAVRDRLFVATAAYLLAPNVLFLLGWLSPAWGAVAAAIAVAAIADAWRTARRPGPALERREWATAAAFALALTVLSGIGGVNVQVTDYLKHNLLFHDLVVRPWPVVFEGGSRGALLCYYVAYYLPAAVVGKALGVAWTAAASFAWGALGVALACAWIARLGRPHGTAVLATFFLIDGFAWLPGLYRFAQKLGLLPGGAGLGPWWAADGFTEQIATFGVPPMRLLFESEPTHLLWVPQHAIAAWLATACVLRVAQERGSARHLGLVLGATLLWSPFIAVGLLPFVVIAALRDAKGALAWPGVAGGLSLAAPVGLYFLAHASYQYVGFLPSRFSGFVDWLRYLLFLFGSVGVLSIAVALVRRRVGTPAGGEWRLFVTAAISLVATTLVVMGYQNDWVMRVSMPALMVFRIVVARLAVELWSRAPRLAPRVAVAAAVLLSADRPLKTTVLAAIGRLPCQGPQPTIAAVAAKVPSLADLPGTAEWDYRDQYLGTSDSWFGRHLLKGSAPGAEPNR